MAKRIYWLIVCVVASLVSAMAQDKYLQYEDLYPGCVDNEASEIYEPKKWPKDLNLPVFPGGGDVELSRYVHNNIEYPEVVDSIVPGAGPDGEDLKFLLRGVVLVKIVVDRCGKVQQPQIVQSVAEEYDTEALRIMEGLPTFKPGDLNDERVKVAMIIPVHFNRVNPKRVIDDGYIEYSEYMDYGSYDGDSSDDGYYEYNDGYSY